MKIFRSVVGFLLVVLMAMAQVPGSAAVTVKLAEDGRALLPVVVCAQASEAEKAAAQTLAQYLGRISGGEFKVETAPVGLTAQTPGIVVGVASRFTPAPAGFKADDPTATEDYLLRSQAQGVLLAGKRMFLWFGGVDEKAKVWVNGQEVGISHGAAFLPFEFDATTAVKPGARNVIVVRLLNEVVDELGTGGITAPVMFYVPAADARPDNIRQLSPTFP